MLWFFERQNVRLHYEIRRQPDCDDFEIVITQPDGSQQVERYSDPRHLVQRATELQSTLQAAGWEPLA